MNDKEITEKYVADLQKVLDTLAMVPANKDLDEDVLESIRNVFEIKSYFVNYLKINYNE